MPQSGSNILICVILAAAASGAAAADFSGNNGFFATFGGEFQYISQEYYNSILETTNLDVIEVWRLEQDQINDLIFKTNLGYRFQNSFRRAGLLADIQISGDRFLGRSEGLYQFGDYDNHLRIFGKFESKSPTGSANENRIEEYNNFQTGLSGRKRISTPVSLNFKVAFDQVAFGEMPVTTVVVGESLIVYQTFPSYDYSLISGWGGGEFTLSEYAGEISWRAGYGHREVPDSAQLEYDQFRCGLGYIYMGLNGMAGFEGDFEFRDYMQPSGQDDFQALTLRGRFTRSVGERFELGGALAADFYRYAQPDFVNRDYTLVRGDLDGTLRIKGFGWGPVVTAERRHQESDGDSDIFIYAESYTQLETGLHLEYMDGRGLFLDSEATYGRRNYAEGGPYLTSYNLWSVSLIANYSIFRNLSLNVMFDGVFETHEVSSDDTNLYLLSIGVTARI